MSADRPRVCIADASSTRPAVVALRGQRLELWQAADGRRPARGSMSSSAHPSGFVLFDPETKECREVAIATAVSRSPLSAAQRKATAQVRQLDIEPLVGLPLSWAVPQCKHIGFAAGEVAGVAVRASSASPACTSCSSANWRIVSSIENRVRPMDGRPRAATCAQANRADPAWRTRRRSRHRACAPARSKPPANTEQRCSSAFSAHRAGRRTTARRGAASDGVPVRGATRPAAGSGHRAGRAPRWPSSTPCAPRPTRSPAGSRRARRQISTTASVVVADANVGRTPQRPVRRTSAAAAESV